MLRLLIILWLSLLLIVSPAFGRGSDTVPRLHNILRDNTTHRRAARAPLTASSSYSVPLLPNTAYAPSELQLLTDSIVRYGTFKNARDYPLLRAHLDVLGLLESTLGFVENALSPLLSRPPKLERKGLLDRLLPLELDLGANTAPEKEVFGVGVNLGDVVQLDLSAKQTFTDPGWANASSTRLINSQSDTAVSGLQVDK